MIDRTSGLSRYFNAIGPIPLLDAQEERELCALAKQGNQKAWSKLVRSNLKLVVPIARDYEGHGVPLEDLVAEGNSGLLEAARRVDPDKGARFSTYAAYWIRQSIRRALSNQRSTVRVPVHVGDKIRAMRRIEHQLEEELKRPPTVEDLSEVLGIAPGDLERLREMAQAQISLDAPVGENSRDSLAVTLRMRGQSFPMTPARPPTSSD